MTVFKTFLKVLNKCKAPLILYTVILIFFGGFSLKTNEVNTSFNAYLPDVYINNLDENAKITENFMTYLKKVSNVVLLDEEDISDALFYRDINIAITIPEGFNRDFFLGRKPKLEIQCTGDYASSLVNIYIEKYMQVANTYRVLASSEEDLLRLINGNLDLKTNVYLKTSLDTEAMSKATTYFNFTNYCILAGCIFGVCFSLFSFKQKNIDDRIRISKINYKKYLMQLFLSTFVFAFFLCLLYVLLGFVLVGKIMFTYHGLIYIVNLFLFTLCALSIAFFLNQVILNKDTINGIVNVIALGSSFLCGAFVPVQFLPDFVLKIARILPSYWFIHVNELTTSLEKINLITLKPIWQSMLMLSLFTCFFFLMSLYVKKKN